MVWAYVCVCVREGSLHIQDIECVKRGRAGGVGNAFVSACRQGGAGGGGGAVRAVVQLWLVAINHLTTVGTHHLATSGTHLSITQ